GRRAAVAELRVFLVDDHAVVREGLKALVNAQSGMAVVGEAADGQDACERVPGLAPDVVVMDVSMPGLTGSQATERLRREGPATGGVLGDREAEVARLTAAGHSNKEIATRLDLSVKTVETYRARAMEKLGLRSRADLVRYAVQQGWLQEGS